MAELEPHRIVRLEDDAVVVLDQRRLPDEEVDLRCGSTPEVAEAIRALAVRGAPAIGVAAAYGMALAAERGEDLDVAYEALASSRPTAVNLRWALDAMRDEPTRERAERIHEDEVERCRADGRACGRRSSRPAPASSRTATPAASRPAATARRSARSGPRTRPGLVEHVWVDETRPLLQGARLTAWELEQLGIPHAVIVDGAAASLMARGEVDLVVTGADRIAANGDTANKIGTYALAVLAAHHGLPLVVVAPDLDARPGGRDRRRDPDRGARPRRGDAALRRAQPGVRRHAGRARRGDRHGARRPSGAATWRPSRARPRASMILDEVDAADPCGARALRVRPGDVRGLRASGRLRRAVARVERRRAAPSSRRGRTTSCALPEPGYGRLGRRARSAGIDALACRAGRADRARRGDGDALRRRRQGRGRGARRSELPLVEARRDGDASGERSAPRSPSPLMTSFQTEDETRAHVAGLGVPEPLWFSQRVSLRLTEDGELFREDGAPVARTRPGHGDLLDALRRSGTLAALRGARRRARRGVERRQPRRAPRPRRRSARIWSPDAR